MKKKNIILDLRVIIALFFTACQESGIDEVSNTSQNTEVAVSAVNLGG